MDAKFSLGRTVITRGAHETLAPASVMEAMLRHATGDWGEVCRDDWQANQDALRDGARLLSAYRDKHGTKFWIITEADRSVTTVLLPEEY